VTVTKSTIVALILWAAPAASVSPQSPPNQQPAETLDDPRPWYHGVPLDTRDKARELFFSGNALFKNGILKRAASKYVEALELWDHPNIHYNLALAQMNLNQPVEAHANFIASLKYGEEPLQQVRFTLAKSFKDLLEHQLALVQIHCDEPRAKVEMDGQLLFTAPGAHEAFVRPGPHVISASKAGFVRNEVARTFEHGARVAFDLKLNTEEELTTYKRRWSPAVPWSVLGTGAAVALVGGGLYYGARFKAKEAEDAVRGQCSNGCALVPVGDHQRRTQRDLLQGSAFVAIAAGGAAILTGSVLAILNRTHPVIRRYEPDVPPTSASQPAITLAPLLDDHARGLVAVGHF
jgi:hypothetical protein